MYCVSVTVLTLSALLTLTSSEVFTSSHKVQRMVMDEERMLGGLKLFIDQKYDLLKKMFNFYSERLREVRYRDPSPEDSELYHPNSMYLTIKKYASDYSVLEDNLENFINSEGEAGPIYLACQKDLTGAQKSLVNLQAIYKMKALDMAKGDYLGFQGPPLTSQDAFDIGTMACRGYKFVECADWFNVSLTLYNSSDVTPTETIPGITAKMGRAYVHLGDLARAEQIYKDVLLLEPNNKEVINLGRELIYEDVNEYTPDETSQNYSRLCSLENQNHIPDPNNPRLVCRYRETLLPYYRFKEEILSVAPFVSVIYNVISDAEGDHLKELAKDKLKRGLTALTYSESSEELRTSDLAWIADEESEMVSSISKRIGHITGLDTSMREPYGPTSAELLQVVNYGLGGLYVPHLDPVQEATDWLKRSGNRLATFLIYVLDQDIKTCL
ncbi:prolyl 4-hydroxylase subunit alpha-2-like [Physella acuta]|uniref:prolyl 4-hydroxylase subunit alpha-2-like n=1 Tax=Physella acuta TaxID=109671 RepID=UPI0027DBD2AB|nr:prolyl 4-hydroxylase subunit alpha-2-like [Physella acuta]